MTRYSALLLFFGALALAGPGLAQAPNPFAAHIKSAMAAMRAGLPLLAAREYRAALALHPTDADASFALAGLLEQVGRTDQAIAQYRETIRLRPDHAPAHNALAGLLEDRGQTAAALAQYRQAAALEPDNALLHFNLAAALADARQRAAARVEYQAALRLKPDFSEARVALEKLPGAGREAPHAPNPGGAGPKPDAHIRQEAHTGAPLREMPAPVGADLRVAPSSSDLPHALVLEAAGRLDEAIAAFQAVLDRNPTQAEARLHLGIALYANGQKAAARREWRQVLTGRDAGAAAQARRLLASYP